MVVWTVANQKGGVGTTTTVITMAGILAAAGRRVLVLDTDPHASLTSCFGYDSDELDHTLFDLFVPSIFKSGDNVNIDDMARQVLIATEYKNISLMAGSIALATLDKSLSDDGSGLIITKALKSLENEFDVVLIDCPPVLGVMMVNALAASSMVLIPTQTEFLALKGLERMMKTFEILRGTKAKAMKYLIVPTMYDKRTRASNISLDSIRKDYGEKVWQGVIPIDTRFRDASERHIPLSLISPKSRGVLAYKKLITDLVIMEGCRL